jgi:sugar phosphate permease
VAILGMFGASYFADKTLNRKRFIWPFLVIASFALFGNYLLKEQSFWLSYSLLVIAGGALYAPYGPFFALITELLPKNVAGGAIGLVNSMGALGSFIGAYMVGYLSSLTGNFNASYILMSVAVLFSALLTLIITKPGESMAATFVSEQ